MSARYVYAWGNNAKRAAMKGRECILLASGRMGSVLIEFVDNGQREITSGRALRKAQATDRQRGLFDA